MAGTLALDEVSLALRGAKLISGLDVTVRPGVVTTIMGPSGCGKSSLLAYVCGTLPAQFQASGRIILDGRDVTALPPEKRRIGILFQDDLLFPHMSVGENLAFGLPADLRGRRNRTVSVTAALEEAGLAGMIERDPASLSGGQRARAAVMRTLLAQPQALLLDEPFNKLDLPLRARFRRFVFEHAQARGTPTLLVTHDPADAESAGGPIIFMGRPSLPSDSANLVRNLPRPA